MTFFNMRCSGRAVLAIVLVLSVLQVGSCTSVKLISDYDEQIDQGATRLQKGMDAYLTKLESDPKSKEAKYDKNKEFYMNYLVELRALLIRAETHPKNVQTIGQLKLMIDSVGEMEAAHKEDDRLEGFSDYRILFNQSWKAIIKLEVAKKRGESGDGESAKGEKVRSEK